MVRASAPPRTQSDHMRVQVVWKVIVRSRSGRQRARASFGAGRERSREVRRRRQLVQRPRGSNGLAVSGNQKKPRRAGAARVAPSESAWDSPGQGPVLRQSRGRFPGCKVFSAQPGSSSSQRPQEEGTVAMSRTRRQAQTGRLWKAQAHGLSPVCSRQWCRDQGGQVGGGKAGGLSLGV